jgi:histidinol dehydrogenase
LAPEHLELAVRDPERWLKGIRHASAIFLGEHAPEPFGDYLAGPNHVLPTGGAARFSSPLSVYDLVKLEWDRRIARNVGETRSRRRRARETRTPRGACPCRDGTSRPGLM